MIFYDDVSPEELLLSYRLGDPDAGTELNERLFARRQTSVHLAAPDAARMLCEWDINEAVFHAMCETFAHYRFVKVRLSTFFHRVLRNELVHIASRRAREKQYGVYNSLDMEREDERGGIYTLHDIIPAGKSYGHPVAAFLFAEQLEAISLLPRGLSSQCMDIVRLVAAGHEQKEVAKICRVPLSKVKYELGKFRKWGLGILKKTHLPDEGRENADRRAMDAFLCFEEE